MGLLFFISCLRGIDPRRVTPSRDSKLFVCTTLSGNWLDPWYVRYRDNSLKVLPPWPGHTCPDAQITSNAFITHGQKSSKRAHISAGMQFQLLGLFSINKNRTPYKNMQIPDSKNATDWCIIIGFLKICAQIKRNRSIIYLYSSTWPRHSDPITQVW